MLDASNSGIGRHPRRDAARQMGRHTKSPISGGAYDREERSRGDRIVSLDEVNADARQRIDGCFSIRGSLNRHPVCRTGFWAIDDGSCDQKSRASTSARGNRSPHRDELVKVASSVAHNGYPSGQQTVEIRFRTKREMDVRIGALDGSLRGRTGLLNYGRQSEYTEEGQSH